MDNFSDTEDFVPPTPQNPPRRVGLTMATSLKKDTKLGRNIKKNTAISAKRKKVSGASPDYKKIKSKTKQVTLLNFLSKSSSSRNNEPINSAKKSLLKDLKTMHIQPDLKHIELDPSVDSNNIHELNEVASCNKLTNLDTVKRNATSESFVRVSDLPALSVISTGEKSSHEVISNETHDIICNDEYVSTTHVEFLNEKDICTEVENLKICSDTIVPESDIFDQTFSWTSDIEWKDGYDLEEPCSTEKQDHENVTQPLLLFRVKDVNRNRNNEVIITLTPEKTEVEDDVHTCVLKGFWADTLINVGDTVHVLKPFVKKQAIIDNDSGFLVTNPDFLLSSTAVVSTLFCMRKAALNHILPSWSAGNEVMMIGNLVHDAFQQAVNNHLVSPKEIAAVMENILKKQENLLAISCQSTPEAEIKTKLLEFIPSISGWIGKHCSYVGGQSKGNVQISNVLGIEDNVWCPTYGIKGKIDMTVETHSVCKQVTKILPLELKTGRASYSAEHIGQINLYSLMLEERNKDASEGLLLYLRDSMNMKSVSADHNSRRGLIQLRNELAHYTHKWLYAQNSSDADIEDCYLPPPINSKKFCGKCEYLLPCTVYKKSFSDEKSLEQGHAMISLISSTTSHLTSSHLAYFSHWSNLLLLESTNMLLKNAFWKEEAAKREKKGMGLGWLSIKDEDRLKTTSGMCVITFLRSNNSPLNSSLKASGLKDGDYVAVSNQNNSNEVAMAMGYIIAVKTNNVQVLTDMDFQSSPQFKEYIFRIDKQVSNSATSFIRNNLMRLMENGGTSNKLRSLVIEKQVPKFTISMPKSVVLLGRSILKPLNKVQQKVILKSLMAEDYLLIKGMPGTGKTSTIVALVQLLVKMKFSVLLASYTHSAVDNILLKLREHLNFVRIGQQARIHPDIRPFSFENVTRNFTAAEQFKVFMLEQKVVASTCLGLNHPLFKMRKFDVAIVDEASQINQIACLGPLYHASRFILVGDDKQLPPLIVNERAKNKGMTESLFDRLLTVENSCMELVLQYRMNEEIMRLCNELTYKGVLKCGSEHTAKDVLELKHSDNKILNTPHWLLHTMKTDLKNSVVFVNTDEILPSMKSSPENNFEAEIVIHSIQFLIKHQVAEINIGVIAPYRQQVDLIEGKLKSMSFEQIEVNTVDQYQGKDKDIIIISCVKCSQTKKHSEKRGTILDDEKRLNVAITRAKKKLIIIGCRSVLIYHKPFEQLLHLFTPEQIVTLQINDFPFLKCT